MNYIPALLIIIIIISVYLHQRNQLDLFNKYPIVKFIFFGVIILTMIVTLYIIFIGGKSGYSWHSDDMNYKGLHRYATGKSQRIALIDSGISKFQMQSDGLTSLSLVGDNQDNNGHGTMMYSILKGYDKEVGGISPDAEIISIKVMDTDEKIDPSIMVKAIEKAIELDSTVINISIGSYLYNEDVSAVLDVALNRGIAIVAASGDYHSADMLFPANKKGVISVGSLSANGRISDFTNAPNDTVINAPGDEIKSVDQNGKIVFNSGTSQSAAIIAGYVALLKDYASQNNVELNNERIVHLLKSIDNNKIDFLDAFSEIN